MNGAEQDAGLAKVAVNAAGPLEYRGAEDRPPVGMPFALKCGIASIVLWAVIPIRVMLERLFWRRKTGPLTWTWFRIVRWFDQYLPTAILAFLLAYCLATLLRRRGRDRMLWTVFLTIIICLGTVVLEAKTLTYGVSILAYLFAIPVASLIGTIAGFVEIRTKPQRKGEAIAGLVLSALNLGFCTWVLEFLFTV